MNATSAEIWKVIENAATIGVAGHTAPDGDALGSSCALALALRRLGKTVYLLGESFADKYREIPGTETIMETAPACDAFFALDSGDEERLGVALPVFRQAAVTVNIDHHGSNTRFAQVNYVVGEASSTSELIFDLLKAWGLSLDREIATALYIGILHDTGGFRHSCTHSSTMEIAGELMAAGAPFTEIQERQLYDQTYPQLRMMGLALERSCLLCGGALIYTYITTEEAAARGGDVKDLDQVVGTIKCVTGVRLAVFFYEKGPGVVKVSLRSDGSVDVSRLAQEFGGGGHIRAAGCTLPGTMTEALERFLPAATAALE